jgi:uncharacterized protein with GYD domain
MAWEDPRLEMPVDRTEHQWEEFAMLFCVTAQYTPQAVRDMLDDPKTNRAEAVKQLLEAAGGKLISIYSTVAEGPGVLVIFEVDDPEAAPAMAGVAVAGGAVQNLKFMRLMSPDEVANVRQKGREIRGAYKPPGK